jgi:DNA polymerase III gamma/tau subunit
MELYKRYRPKTLKSVLGQPGAISVLEQFVTKQQIPHAILFTGPSGTGKTTLARILAAVLGCAPQECYELNTADFRGIDMARNVRSAAIGKPLLGKVRVWIIDECHQMTKDAQQALLKILEDTPEHAYFMLATTEPQKLLNTINTRCTHVKLQTLDAKAMQFCLQRVIEREKIQLADGLLQEIAEAAEGSARKALVILEQVSQVVGAEEQRAAITSISFNKDMAFSLARAVTNTQSSWPEIATILREIKDTEQDVEGVRYTVLGYARSCLVSEKTKGPDAFRSKCFAVIDIFAKNFYDSKHAGLAAACWEAKFIAK